MTVFDVARLYMLVTGSVALPAGALANQIADAEAKPAVSQQAAKEGSAPAPMTLKEFMELEQLDGLIPSPDGRYLLYTTKVLAGPSHGLRGSPGDSHERTFVSDLATGKTRQVGPVGTSQLIVNGWRPDSGAFIVQALIDGQLRLGVYDIQAAAIEWLEGRPQMISSAIAARWVGKSVVFRQPLPGVAPMGSGQDIAAELKRNWDSNWIGGEVVATVSSNNPAVKSTFADLGTIGLEAPGGGPRFSLPAGGYHSETGSPDGKYLAVVRYAEEVMFPLSVTGAGQGRGQLEIFEIKPDGLKQVFALPGVDIAYESIRWSQDSRRVLAGGRPVTGKDGEPAALYIYDTASGQSRTITPPTNIRLHRGENETAPLGTAGWMGDLPVFVGKTDGAPKKTSSHSSSRLDDGRSSDATFHLYVADGDQIRDVTKAFDESVESFVVDRAGNALVVAANTVWRVHSDGSRVRVTGKSLAVERLAAGPRVGDGPNPPAYYASDKAERIALRVREADGTIGTVVLDMRSGRTMLRASSKDSIQYSADLSTFVRVEKAGWKFTVTTGGVNHPTRKILAIDGGDRPVGKATKYSYFSNGRTLTGWILSPAIPTRTPPPVVLMVYPGKTYGENAPETYNEYSPLLTGQLWSGLGYAVVYPSLPVRPPSVADVPDQLADEAVAAIDALAGKGLVDKTRVGIIGHSGGGFATAAILSRRSDRFAAGIAMNGAYDFQHGWGTRRLQDDIANSNGSTFAGETLYIEKGQFNLEVPPWVNPERYQAASPFYAADKIKAPLMILAGDLDIAPTGLAGAQRFYAALKRTGNPAVLVRYWGEGHVAVSGQVLEDQWQRSEEWFGRYVMRKSGE